jgi:phosphoribosyl-AMP cyclohydrolase
MSASELDQSLTFTPRFDAHGLIPVVAIDAKDGAVLMLAYMNAEAIRATLETGQATYWSRSRQALWRKGETSGHTQRVISLKVDCDQDALLMTVEQVGPACHTGETSCFYRTVTNGGTLKRD